MDPFRILIFLIANRTLFALGILVLAALRPRVGARGLRLLLKGLERLARRPAAMVLVVSACGFVASASVATWIQRPEPEITDEASYLLAADTFTRGRLTNPTHPAWEHFETFNVIHRPSYASKYPPGQGLSLALGQWATGTPLVGLWLVVSFMCGALTWMLQAWVPGRWALFGGLLVVLAFGWTSYWGQSYWGGGLAAAGGALVFGALPGMRGRRPATHAAVLALGLAILANTRPFEGLVVSLVPAVWVLARLLRSARARDAGRPLRVIGALALVLLPVGAWMLHYNQRVTGDPLTFPYEIHEAQYAVAPSFVWEAKRPVPEYRHEVLQKEWMGLPLDVYENQQDFRGWLAEVWAKVRQHSRFYLGRSVPLPGLLTLLLMALCLPWFWRDSRRRILLASGALLVLGLSGETYQLPHYAAPGMGIFLILFVTALRRTAALRWGGRRIGQSLVFGLFVALVWQGSMEAFSYLKRRQSWNHGRAAIQRRLAGSEERDLILVRYGPRHGTSWEWVFNGADLDGAPVLWARDMGEARNAELITLFPERRVWRLDVGFGQRAPQPIPYLAREEQQESEEVPGTPFSPGE